MEDEEKSGLELKAVHFLSVLSASFTSANQTLQLTHFSSLHQK